MYLLCTRGFLFITSDDMMNEGAAIAPSALPRLKILVKPFYLRAFGYVVWMAGTTKITFWPYYDGFNLYLLRAYLADTLHRYSLLYLA